MRQILYFLPLVLLSIFSVKAQKYKFGKVSKTELQEEICPVETGAHACILYKKRNTHFDYDEVNGFIIKEEFYFRIKIYDKDGYDFATKSIPLYYDIEKGVETSEKIKDFKAVTYNLEGGKIKKTKLNKEHIYLEKTTDHIKRYKFTMPNLKPGSVVEWKYTLISPFFTQLERVVIQYDIPVKKEEIYLSIPDFFRYRFHQRGNLSYLLRRKSRIQSHRVVDSDMQSTLGVNYHNNYQYQENIYEVEMMDVPALHKEPYAGNMENFRASIIFELAVVAMPGRDRKDYAITWEDVAKDAYEDEKFGKQLEKRDYLQTSLQSFKDKANDLEKLKNIFEWAKQKIKWNQKYDYYVDDGVVEAFNQGTGNVAEVNINLINMLKASGFEAHPVLVSTIQHGVPVYPTRTGFDYVIAAVKLNGKQYLLDATETYTNLEVLPERVLNFEGRLIKDDGASEAIDLFPNQHSKIFTTIDLNFDEDEFSGMAISVIDKYEAYEMRNQLGHTSKESQQAYLEQKYEDFEIENFRINQLDDPYKKIKESIQFTTDAYQEEISGKIYLQPLLMWSMDSNPFKSNEREFPVFFNYPYILSTTINITIPEGYEIQSIPSSVLYEFGDKDGGYEYKIKQTGNKIRLVSNYVINTSVVSSKTYPELKTFIDKVIKKQKEKIVLQKKN